MKNLISSPVYGILSTLKGNAGRPESLVRFDLTPINGTVEK
jgi:hypothetical protein